jgi:hypothetical protein
LVIEFQGEQVSDHPLELAMVIGSRNPRPIEFDFVD